MRVLQGLLQGRVRQVLVVVYTKANRFAQQRTVAILHSAKLCRTAVEQKRAVASYATLGIRVCFFCRRMPLNQSKALSREELQKSWLLWVQRELSGSWRFNLIPPAESVLLQSKGLKGFSVMITFFPGQGLRKAFMSVWNRAMCSGTSDTVVTGASSLSSLQPSDHPGLPLRIPSDQPRVWHRVTRRCTIYFCLWHFLNTSSSRFIFHLGIPA